MAALYAFCLLYPSLLYKKFRADFSLPWISVAGAWAFNAGQVAVVSYIVGDARVALYILPLFAVGAVAGWAVGWLADAVCRRIGGEKNETFYR